MMFMLLSPILCCCVINCFKSPLKSLSSQPAGLVILPSCGSVPCTLSHAFSWNGLLYSSNTSSLALPFLMFCTALSVSCPVSQDISHYSFMCPHFVQLDMCGCLTHKLHNMLQQLPMHMVAQCPGFRYRLPDPSQAHQAVSGYFAVALL